MQQNEVIRIIRRENTRKGNTIRDPKSYDTHIYSYCIFASCSREHNLSQLDSELNDKHIASALVPAAPENSCCRRAPCYTRRKRLFRQTHAGQRDNRWGSLKQPTFHQGHFHSSLLVICYTHFHPSVRSTFHRLYTPENKGETSETETRTV